MLLIQLYYFFSDQMGNKGAYVILKAEGEQLQREFVSYDAVVCVFSFLVIQVNLHKLDCWGGG